MNTKIIKFSIKDLQEYFKVNDFNQLIFGPIGMLVGHTVIVDHPTKNLIAQPIISVEVIKEKNVPEEIKLYYLRDGETRDWVILNRNSGPNSPTSNWVKLVVPL